MVDPKECELKFTAFNKLFERNMSLTPTYFEAYEKTEDEHVDLFSSRRFVSYEAFRAKRKRFLNSGKK